MACESVCCAMLLVLVLAIVSPGVQSVGRPPFLGRREPPRTLQMIGSVNPRMLHKISADLQPDTSKVVHIQVPYYVDRPKQRPKKFQPWVLPPRNQRFASSGGGPHHHHFPPVQQQLHHPGPAPPFGGPFREAPFKAKPILPNEFLANPGPYDTPFVPVMKPSPVNPLPVEPAPPEIAFEPISILPLESPSFDTVRNHVRYLKQKQAAFFEGQGREFGLAGGGSVAPEELAYYGEHGGGSSVHNGDPDRDSERNTLSEHDFGQNDRKYDRRGKAHEVVVKEEEEEGDDEEDFYDSEGKQYRDDDFEDSRDEADRVAAFEPKKVYTQVRHREVVRHVPRSKEPEKEDEEEDHDEDQEDQDEQEDPKQSDDEDDEEEEDEDHQERHTERRPVRERINLQRKNIVYSEKGRQADKFDHGSEESFGEFEENEKAKPKRRNRIKRSLDDREEPEMLPVQQESNMTSLVDVLAMMILGNDTLPPHAEALTDPRELHGEELIRFLDEAIQNTTQYLPDKRSDERTGVISIVSPPSNVVKFPYYTRPASEIDVDSALRYAENLTSFSNGLYGTKISEGIECNEVDVELEEEPEPIEEGAEGFKPIRRLKGLGDKIDCLKRKHFGSEPLDNPLFREEFVGVPRKMYVPKGTTPAVPQQQQQTQPNPAVAVYNDVIRHIKKHLASQQRRKNSKSDTEQDTLMIAVPRVLRLDRNDAQPASSGVHLKREARLVFPQANPLPLSNHISVPIFDISKFVPRFMMRPNDDLYGEDLLPAVTVPTTTPVPRLSSPKVRLQTLVRTAEQLAEGAVEVEEGVEKILLTTQRTPTGTVRDDIADAFDDVLTKPNQPPAPLPPIKPYSVVEQDASGPPEPTFNKSGPPYAALALEPPVAQSILKQRIAPLERNRLDVGKAKRSPVKMRKPRRPTVTRKKVLVFYT